MGTIMKQCTTCGLEKPQDAFLLKRRDSEKRYASCRACQAERSRKYRQENRQAVAEQKRKYYQENREADLERNRKYQQENRQAIAERKRKYYQENRQALTEQKRKYQRENREAALERNRNWRRANPTAALKQKHARRARKAASVESRWHKSPETPGKCYWCGNDYGDSYHLDHIKPLSLHGPDRDYNIVKTCPSCNCAKGSLHPLAWIAKLVNQA